MSWLARLKKPESAPIQTPVSPCLSGGRGVSEKTRLANDPAALDLKSPPSAQPPDLVRPPAPAPDKPAKPPKQTFIEHADTWLHLDRAYQAHHFKCPTCKAAGLGYGLRCGAGAALWTAYSSAT